MSLIEDIHGRIATVTACELCRYNDPHPNGSWQSEVSQQDDVTMDVELRVFCPILCASGLMTLTLLTTQGNTQIPS